MNSFSAFHWAIVGAVCYLIYRIFAGRGGPSSNRVICKACGHAGPGKRITKGSVWIELLLWLCLLIPGLIYTIWRLTTRYDGCSYCGSNQVIPPNSPLGRKLAAEIDAASGPSTNSPS